MARFVELDQLVPLLRKLPANPRIVLSGNLATPPHVVELFEENLSEYTLSILNAHGDLPDRPGVTLETCFVGPAMRGKAGLRYVPSRLSLVPVLLHHQLRPDAVFVSTSLPRGPIDHNGLVSLGTEVNILPAAIESAHARGAPVVAVMNRQMPFTFGDAVLGVNDFDALVEVDESLPVVPTSRSHDVADQIADRITEYIHSGSTLQAGIGAIPDAVLNRLTVAQDLRIWTETVSDSLLRLEEAGALASEVPVRTSFLMGSPELYEWADENRRLDMMRTERANNPSLIARHYCMISINATLQVDLHGQANASRVNGTIYSGFGGSTDFIIGALHSPGGRSFMALPSWHAKADASTIIPELDGPATSFQQSAVVTEHGIAWLLGDSEAGQARNLIDHAAHPAAREQLRAAAAQMRLG